MLQDHSKPRILPLGAVLCITDLRLRNAELRPGYHIPYGLCSQVIWKPNSVLALISL